MQVTYKGFSGKVSNPVLEGQLQSSGELAGGKTSMPPNGWTSQKTIPDIPPQFLDQMLGKIASLDIQVKKNGDDFASNGVSEQMVNQYSIDPKKVDSAKSIAQAIKMDWEESNKLQKDYEITLSSLRQSLRIRNNDQEISDPDLTKKIILTLSRRKNYDNFEPEEKMLWDNANALRTKINERLIKPNCTFLKFDVFKKVVKEKANELSKTSKKLNPKIAENEEILALVAYFCLKSKLSHIEGGGFFDRFPGGFFLKDKNFETRIRTLGKYYLVNLKGLNSPVTAKDKISSLTDELAEARLSELFHQYNLDKLLEVIFPTYASEKESFKEDLINCLSKNGLGKVMLRETGREFIFTRSQFITWYKRYQKNQGQSFLKELEANSITESFNYFAKGDLTIALAILFEQEEKIETSTKKLKILDLAEGNVFVYRFNINTNNGRFSSSMWM